MQIQWYPGHMTKAVRMMEENVALCDVLLYVLDSRAVYSCNNPVFNKLIGNKPTLYVFNKCDLVESKAVAEWCKVFDAEGKTYVKSVGTSGNCPEIIAALKKLCADKVAKYKARGANANLRAMVVGVPNSGKSTLINSMRKKASAVTGDRPGVTRGKQWLALDDHIDLLDTPGTLWGKFENQTVARHLAYVGSIRDDVLDIDDLALEFLKEVSVTYPELIKARYSIAELAETPLELFEQIAIARGFKLRGGDVDYSRAAATVLDDFRKGRLGKIMLELPNPSKA